MICKTCEKATPSLVKEECKSCYNNTYQKNKRKAEKEKNKIELTKDQKEIITGLMLGDGCVQYSHGNIGNCNPRLTLLRSSKDKDYMHWIYDKIKNLCNSKPFEYNVFDKRTQKTYHSIRLYSKSIECFKQIHQEWYDGNIKKLPIDLQLTSQVLLVWFLDDGSFINKGTNYELKLSTHGFSKTENEYLATLLSNRYSSNFRLCRNINKYYISTSTKGAISFIKEINNIFPQCMSRKSDKWNDININDISFKDGVKFNDIKFDYLISKFITETQVSSFRTKDLAEALDYWETNSTGTVVPNRQIGYRLKKYKNSNLISVSKVAEGKTKGIHYSYTVNDISKFIDLFDIAKKQIETYNIQLNIK